jgi:NhaP-type Na+/H+ or K+/H+ antiporter
LWARSLAYKVHDLKIAAVSQKEEFMHATLWFLIVGGMLVVMALAGSVLKRLPLSSSLVYLAVGVGIGPAGLALVTLDPLTNAPLIERLSEVAVIISLFTAGLKLRARLRSRRWALPLRLAFGSMALTVGLITLVGWYVLGLPLGAAVLLGAVLAPTDPVLASDVQVDDPVDRDRVRFGLTGEAGMNDGTAFPFLMLGLGLLGLHELGAYGWRWLAIDVIWAIVGGLGIGWLSGMLIGRLVVYLRREYKEALGLDEFLTLGLIGLSYGAALLAVTYGFLAVFAAGLALRHVEMRANADQPPEEVVQVKVTPADDVVATDPAQAPAYMAQAVLGFNEQLERIAEIAMVVLLGAMLVPVLPDVPADAIWFVPLLLLVIRPLSVAIGLFRSPALPMQRRLIGWFGIRGIGSIYYLMYAIVHGLPADLARPLTALTLLVVAVSIMVHGISVTPLMNAYRRDVEQQRQPT